MNPFKYKSFPLSIIGRVPPPIGGVTIHTKRLLEYLKQNNFFYTFYDLKLISLSSFIKLLFKSRVCHLHANNPLFILAFTLLCKLFKTKSIITIHGNIGYHNLILSFFEKLALILSDIPIVLNNFSYKTSITLNKRTQLITSFIAPRYDTTLSEQYKKNIKRLRRNKLKIFCTNAFDYVFDSDNNEIYGIKDLIDFFKDKNNLVLLISDPSSSYYSSFRDITRNNSNILFLTESHSFSEVVKISDCFIRNTSTDGDSLSIKESLYFGTPVIASDCVDRPKEVILFKYGSITTLGKSIEYFLNNEFNFIKPKEGGHKLLNLYKSFL